MPRPLALWLYVHRTGPGPGLVGLPALGALLCLLTSTLGLLASAEAWSQSTGPGANTGSGSAGRGTRAGTSLHSHEFSPAAQGGAAAAAPKAFAEMDRGRNPEGEGGEERIENKGSEGGSEVKVRQLRTTTDASGRSGPTFTDRDPELSMYQGWGYPERLCGEEPQRILTAKELQHEPEVQWMPVRGRYLFPHCNYGRLSNVVSCSVLG